MDFAGSSLVFPPVLSSFWPNTRQNFSTDMAVTQDLLTLLALAWFCLAFACFGNSILRLLKFELERDSEHLLVAIGVGLISTEVFLFLVQFTQHIRQGNLFVIVLLCIPLFSESSVILRKTGAIFQLRSSRSAVGSYLLLFIGIVLSAEFLTSMAPLAGSDAMHYHFTVQRLILEQGFHPFFSNSHSFLCGQHHQLILLGLALGSEKLALGFIFLGGVLSAAVLASLAARWGSEQMVLGITLLFLLTPVVFWQMSSSGAPDIYMAFFAGTVLIVMYQSADAATWRQALLVGFLTGGVAGAKYTGCLIAIAVALAIATEFRSVAKTAIFALGTLVGGISPYLRNTIWTGNPVFPFLSARLSPHLVTVYGLQNLANDTGAATNHNPAQLVQFLFFAGIRAGGVGFWDFFGPTVLALAPLVILAFKNTKEWRVAFLVWFFGSLCIFFASGLPRFLLALYPIALFCIVGGLKSSLSRDWKIAHAVSVGTMGLMIVAGAAGLAVYCKKPLLAGVGFVSEGEYLSNRAQDYQASQAINQMLGTPEHTGRALLFLRHQYYLRIPYLNGDPGTSFEVDPDQLKTPEQWKQFLKAKGVTYVVRTPHYPVMVAAPLEELEKRGDLALFGQREVDNFQGMRVNDVHVTIPVVILRVNF